MAYPYDVKAEMRDGETLANQHSSVAGSRGNVDVDEFEILDADGRLVGLMTVREEMDPHRFAFEQISPVDESAIKLAQVLNQGMARRCLTAPRCRMD